MSSHIQLTFGFGIGVDKDGAPLEVRDNQDVRIRRICRKAAELFGGYTMIDTNGGWIDPRGNLIEEPGRQLTVFPLQVSGHARNKVIAENRQAMIDIIKHELNQEAACVIEQPVNFSIA